ncbi:hypothetical protein CYK59_03895 [Latilactobacillus curvatus]|uniref:hypothetical protein n=1 Tax=Latilactobacillus curvatus TaxID=28038 RepID=UPI000F7CF2A5|nr:hypothetical protein [Latilactobacillus curvatus]AZP96144.1 hypothetical protein CYK59_03895 [Latilactobacillus curvatus]
MAKVTKLNVVKKEIPKDTIVTNGEDGGVIMRYVTKTELDNLELKLSSKIELASVESKKDTELLISKVENNTKLLWWIMGIISAGIVVPMGAAVIKYIITN